MKLTECVKFRLDRFYELLIDEDYGARRAIIGLKSWQGSQKHRFTAYDNSAINEALAIAIRTHKVKI